jgi:uncharacterized protein involved in oxidation of intracellular sulfur
MEYLLVLNDSPYGSERTYNALRLAGALAKVATMEVSIFLLGDGVVSGLRMQCPADASYNVQEMLRLLAAQGVSIGACRTCLEARGIDGCLARRWHQPPHLGRPSHLDRGSNEGVSVLIGQSESARPKHRTLRNSRLRRPR